MRIDTIYILKMKHTQLSPLLLTQLQTYFPETPHHLFEVSGVLTGKNEGDMQMSLLDILCHRRPDEVALDITQNHLQMIHQAFQDSQVQTVLFLEEDAVFETSETRFRSVWNTLQRESSTGFDIFYLGYCNWPWIVSFFVSPHVIVPSSPLLAHAYILSRSGMQKVEAFVQHYGKQFHIDKLFCHIPSFRKRASHPLLCYQSKNPALLTRLTDRWNIHLSNPLFLQIFHWTSLLLGFLGAFLISYYLCRIGVSLFHRIFQT